MSGASNFTLKYTAHLPISGLKQSKHVCGRSSAKSVTLPADSRPDLNRFSIRFLHTTSTAFRSRHLSRSTWSHVKQTQTITAMLDHMW